MATFQFFCFRSLFVLLDQKEKLDIVITSVSVCRIQSINQTRFYFSFISQQIVIFKFTHMVEKKAISDKTIKVETFANKRLQRLQNYLKMHGR